MGQVKINEYSCANFTYLNSFGDADDWVELYNPGATPVNLNGYYLTDNPNNLTKWQFGNVTIPAGGYLVVWASGRNINTGPEIHTNFKLTQTRPEKIILLSPSFNVVDSITLVPTQKNHSYGRATDGASQWAVFDSPTPGATNNTSTPRQYCPGPQVSPGAGFYSSPITVTVTVPPGYTIRYTLDGSTPGPSSPVYTGPITISSTTVLRVRAFSSNPSELPSFVESNTYFINTSHTLPVISIYGDQLYDLIAMGNSWLEPETGLELFVDDTLRAKAYGETNKHGNDSWAYPQRGIDFVTRDQYGYSWAIRYKIFPEKPRKNYQRIILKAAANDNYPFECPAAGNPYAWGDPSLLDGAHIRDAFIHTAALRGKLNLDVRTYRPCVLYVNGQYWGVYEIREKVDDIDFMEYYYDVEPEDSLYMLKTWGSTWAEYGGNNAINDWDNLKNFILSNNMSDPANYAYVTSQLDIASLADYIILNSFVVCSDWLNWNTIWYRGVNASSKIKKWRYGLWDEDATFRHYINYTGVPNVNVDASPCDPQSLGDPGGQGHIPILNALMQNPSFRQFFITRYFDLLNTALSCDTLIPLLDQLINTIAPEMQAHINRWTGGSYGPGSYSAWWNNYQALRNFIIQRCSTVQTGFSSCYNTTGPYRIVVDVYPPGAGRVTLNSLTLTSFAWSGNYPGNIDIILKAIPEQGYCFDHWQLLNHTPSPSPYSDSITISLTAVDSIVAVFTVGTQTPEITASSSYICSGDTVELSVNSGGSVLWSPSSSLTCATCPTTQAFPASTTTYTVSVSGPCATGTASYTVTVYPPPHISISGDTQICYPEKTTLTATGGLLYQWSPTASVSCPSCSTAEFAPPSTTTYTLVAASDPLFLCRDTTTVTIRVTEICPRFFIPTAFSPNGDGNNDVFLVYGRFSSYHLVIYDRWGNKVFETNDPKTGWDGSFRGQPAEPGTYSFVFRGVTTAGENVKKTGFVVLVR